ncbi:MAG: response regulator [Lentisphaeria bacterium]|nr:response regulator [Lentisphaeria bacterium]
MTGHDKNAATVHVVDDDPSVRKSLTRLLTMEGFAVVAHSSAAAFLDTYLRDRPGCLIVDLQLPGMDGLELQKSLADVNCHLPTVFISGHGSIPSTVEAMKGGAVDFITKPFEEADLLAAVRGALEKDRAVRRERIVRKEVQGRYDSMTPREQEVFTRIVVGMLNKEIGETMGISEKTVKVHRARVMAKMEADSLAELVRFAEKMGM